MSSFPSLGLNMAFNMDHPSYHDLRPLYQVDAACVMTATAEFTIDEDNTYFCNVDVPAEQLMYSFDIDARHTEGYVSFIDIKIRSIKKSASITVTVGRRANRIATFNRLSIDDRHGSPFDPNMPDMSVSLNYHCSETRLTVIHVDHMPANRNV
jgi:hypothetical protein